MIQRSVRSFLSQLPITSPHRGASLPQEERSRIAVSSASHRRGDEAGIALRGVLLLLVIIGVISGAVLFFFGQVVPPGQMGVRQIYFGPGQGYSNKGLKPGLHWAIPFHSQIHLIPETVQALEFNREEQSALDIQTKDGAVVDVDVSILTRFYETAEGDHGGPGDLISKLGLSREKWEEQVRSASRNFLKSALSQLNSSDFYEPALRFKFTQEARNGIAKALEPFGIGVDDVFLRRYTYRSTRIDDAIFQKNLQDQEERLNEAKSKLAAARAKVESVSAEWDAKIETLRVQGSNNATVIRSEADLYENQKRAQADLNVAKAQAEVDRLRAQALSMTSGADIFVARQMTPLLLSLKGGVVSNIDPYDVEGWAKRLGVGGK